MRGCRILSIFIFICLARGFADAELRFDSWTTDDGLPQNSVLATARTRDGYLWLGTFEGLSRFDGVSFTDFNNINTPEFKSNFVRALLEDREGNLWIGIDGGGLVRLAEGRFHRFTPNDGFVARNVMVLYESRDGSVIAGSDDAGVSIYRDGTFTNFTTQNGLPSNFVTGFAEDDAGQLWIATRKGVAILKDGVISAGPKELAGLEVRTFARTADGDLWFGSMSGLSRFSNGRLSEVVFDFEDPRPRVDKLYSETNGDLLIGMRGYGLWRMRASGTERAKLFDAPGNNMISSIERDSDGTLWVGSQQGGLHRYRERRFRVYTTEDGLGKDNANSMIQRADGSILVSNDGGLHEFRDGKFTPFAAQPERVSALANDPAGNLWLASPERIKRIGPSGTLELTEADGIKSIALSVLLARRDGSVLIGTANGLWEFRNGTLKAFSEADGLPHEYVISMFEDSRGNTWIGTRHGLARFRDGKLESWTINDGLASDHILSFNEDEDGTVWIGTSGGGLLRFRDGKFAGISSANGLYDNLAFVILKDSVRNFWMCGNRGVYRVGIDELNEVADGLRTSVNSYSYDTDDGLLNRECNGGSPAGFKAADGRLWFPTVRGVAVVDPLGADSKPPRVLIEQIGLGGQPRPVGETVEIGPNEGNLEIRYTGISWERPKKVRFRYKLEGLNDDWIDVGTRRTAYFSYLPPGEYVFNVIADNGEGVWNTGGERVLIRVYPPFYRTYWFTAIVAVAIAAIIFLLYWRRVRQLQRSRNEQQEFARKLIASQEQERKRIAAELHDSLGQRLVVIKNLALMFLNARRGDADQLSQIDEISTEASSAISEVKTISYNLRPYQLDRIGLTKAVEAVVRSARAGSDIEFTTSIDDIDDYFPKDSEINFYRIVQECVTNIVKHSSAKTASVAIRRTNDLVELEVADDGIGFVPGQTESITGGFGLLGITERVELFGGRVEIRSAPNNGTNVRIRLRRQDFANPQLTR